MLKGLERKIRLNENSPSKALDKPSSRSAKHPYTGNETLVPHPSPKLSKRKDVASPIGKYVPKHVLIPPREKNDHPRDDSLLKNSFIPS